MDQERYLVAIDLDDTTLDNLHCLNEGSVAALKKVQELGHKVMIATARPSCLTMKHYESLGLDTLVSLCNGAYMLHPKDVSFEPIVKEIPAQTIRAIFERMSKTSFERIWIENDDDIHITSPIEYSEYYEEVRRCSRVHPLDTHKLTPMDTGRLIILMHDDDAAQRTADAICALPGIQVYRRKWNRGGGLCYLSIASLKADKWYSVKEAAQYYGISEKNTITFGDEYNDHMMIMNAGIGFAMKNGNETLKAQAPRITIRTNRESGVGYELDRIFRLDLF